MRGREPRVEAAGSLAGHPSLRATNVRGGRGQDARPGSGRVWTQRPLKSMVSTRGQAVLRWYVSRLPGSLL